MNEGTEWLRARGIGRERFAGYLADYLKSNGFDVERTDGGSTNESVVAAKLVRMNPAVPPAAKELRFRLYPTSGGAAVIWVFPETIPDAERNAMSRFTRELVAHLQRSVATESHATAKVSSPPNARLPWETPSGAP